MSESDDHNNRLVEEFRANGGKVGGYFKGKTLLLLHTKVARTGREHINPAAYVTDGDRWVVIASNQGLPANPAWYYNLLAHPDVTIEVGTKTFHVRAMVAQEPERTRLYDKMAQMMSAFDDYRRKTTRQIPVIILSPTK
ncbi:MAG: F420H(2)-dependent quinone reductase [Anaerolineales bacterium]|nr:F420H(2)-dependent quinone reductase [Anaerolineales bacterium]